MDCPSPLMKLAKGDAGDAELGALFAAQPWLQESIDIQWIKDIRNATKNSGALKYCLLRYIRSSRCNLTWLVKQAQWLDLPCRTAVLNALGIDGVFAEFKRMDLAHDKTSPWGFGAPSNWDWESWAQAALTMDASAMPGSALDAMWDLVHFASYVDDSTFAMIRVLFAEAIKRGRDRTARRLVFHMLHRGESQYAAMLTQLLSMAPYQIKVDAMLYMDRRRREVFSDVLGQMCREVLRFTTLLPATCRPVTREDLVKKVSQLMCNILVVNTDPEEERWREQTVAAAQLPGVADTYLKPSDLKPGLRRFLGYVVVTPDHPWANKPYWLCRDCPGVELTSGQHLRYGFDTLHDDDDEAMERNQESPLQYALRLLETLVANAAHAYVVAEAAVDKLAWEVLGMGLSR